MKNDELWKNNDYKNLPVMVDSEKGQFCKKKILEEIKQQLDYAQADKNRVFFMRYDVRFPEKVGEHTNNKTVSDFQANLMKNLNRKGLKAQYVLVREQSREKHQHYHGILLLNGHKTQSINGHIATAERLWNSALGLPPREGGYGLIEDCTKDRNGNPQVNGVMLRHDDPDYESKKEDCFRRASYLAKVNTKNNNPQGQREMFSSRIPKK